MAEVVVEATLGIAHLEHLQCRMLLQAAVCSGWARALLSARARALLRPFISSAGMVTAGTRDPALSPEPFLAWRRARLRVAGGGGRG